MTTSSSPRSQTPKWMRNVAAHQLRKWGPLLKLDTVRAGDVLLTRARGWESRSIALLTWGPYSHAAIFLSYRHPPFRYEDPAGGGMTLPERTEVELVEADDYGSARAPSLRPLHLRFGGNTWHVARLPGEVATAVLLRHPAISSVNQEMLERAASVFDGAELWRSYPTIDRLVGTLPWPRPIKRVVRHVLSAVPRTLSAVLRPPKDPVLSGSFCSELVAKFFEQLPIPLFSAPIASEEVSPNRLMPARSFLEIVPDAFFTAADIPDDAVGEFVDLFHEKEIRPVHVPGRIRVKAFNELLVPDIRKKMEDVSELCRLVQMTGEKSSDNWIKVNHYLKSRVKAHDQARDQHGSSLHEQIFFVMSHAPQPYRSTLGVLFIRSTFLKMLRARLGSEELPMSIELGLNLRIFHDAQFIDVRYRFMRTAILLALSDARSLARRQDRKKLIAIWRSEKEARAKATPIPYTYDAEGELIINNVWSEMRARASQLRDPAAVAAL